jgi:predicted ATPase/transcriptional regulator with XRE-family HTH domain
MDVDDPAQPAPGMGFGDLLRRWRKATGLSQGELAARAGLSLRGINDLERGVRRRPRADTVTLLANALGLSGEERASFAAAARRPPGALPPSAADQPSAPLDGDHRQRRPHSLPIPPTPLLGRAREVADLCALLHGERARLVTLTGPGGVGKTRLALQVADEVGDDFADGVWFVSLSRLTDPALVIPTIAHTLGLREAGGTPFADLLPAHLHARHLLLLLDNCEPVAAAAVADLVARCPGLTALSTSRAALRLQGEREYRVGPLALPAPASPPIGRPLPVERMLEAPAVALFVERARARRPDFRLTGVNAGAVAEICTRLDGLPLAIDLAAAWVTLLPPVRLLARLEPRLPLLAGGARDLEERQRTMQNTLAWSYELLSPAEQRLFRRLGVFVGGCTLEAAEAVCSTPAADESLGEEVLAGLRALADQSLVQPERGVAEERERESEARFRLLHVVREYALERLKANGEGAEGAIRSLETAGWREMRGAFPAGSQLGGDNR